MNFAKLIIICLCLVGFFAACADDSKLAAGGDRAIATVQTSAADAARLSAARALYEQRCARCHQATGAGGSIQIENIPLKVPSLNDSGAIAEPDGEYIKKIRNGGDGMPAFKGKIADADIDSLVRYIRVDLQGK